MYVTETETKFMEESQQAVKSTSILPCILKAPYFLTRGLKYNKEVQEYISSCVCDFGARK